MEAALEQDLGAAQLLGLADLAQQFVPGEHRASTVFGRLEKGAELTGRDADIGVVDVAVNDIGDNRLRVQPPADGVGHEPEAVQVAVAGKDQEVLAVDPLPGHHPVCYFP